MFEEYAGTYPTFVSYKDKLHGPAPKPNNLFFTKKWPGKTSWAAGKYFQIIDTEFVDYARSYTIPGSDYVNVDISNASGGIKLYPETDYQAHEILVGMKPGNYVLQIDVPNGNPLSKLPESTMIVSQTSTTLKYLNAKNPEDSPAYNPVLKFWALKDMDAIVLRPLTLSGVDYERCTLTFKIAKHLLEELPARPDGKPHVADTIRPISEMRWS